MAVPVPTGHQTHSRSGLVNIRFSIGFRRFEAAPLSPEPAALLANPLASRGPVFYCPRQKCLLYQGLPMVSVNYTRRFSFAHGLPAHSRAGSGNTRFSNGFRRFEGRARGFISDSRRCPFLLTELETFVLPRFSKDS